MAGSIEASSRALIGEKSRTIKHPHLRLAAGVAAIAAVGVVFGERHDAMLAEVIEARRDIFRRGRREGWPWGKIIESAESFSAEAATPLREALAKDREEKLK
jgi:hypothetical protein